jgi:murein endopeptidase
VTPSRRTTTVAGCAAVLALAAVGAGLALPEDDGMAPRAKAEPVERAERAVKPKPRRPPRVRWRRSLALGTPAAGRLVRGVQLPAWGRHFATWDPVLRRSPDRGWRRWGTDRLVRHLLRTARAYRAANPGAPRLLIGDLSRPRGGSFDARFGSIGHQTHQNGLDADVYYPRKDRASRPARHPSQIDLRLAQDLVDRLLRSGARTVIVGPNVAVKGRVVRLVNHDDHLHVRIA